MRILKGSFGCLLAAAMAMTAVPVTQLAAQEVVQTDSSSMELTEAVADSLEPGQYRWEPQRATQGELSVIVSLAGQMAYVYRGGTLIGVSTVSTGMAGYDTPIGTFRITQKKVHHISNLYHVPMPFMQRLTDDGIALHAGRIPGYPASHGCVRLPAAFAKALFGETKIGMSVTIQDEDPMSAPVEMAEAETNLQLAAGHADGAAAP